MDIQQEVRFGRHAPRLRGRLRVPKVPAEPKRPIEPVLVEPIDAEPIDAEPLQPVLVCPIDDEPIQPILICPIPEDKDAQQEILQGLSSRVAA